LDGDGAICLTGHFSGFKDNFLTAYFDRSFFRHKFAKYKSTEVRWYLIDARCS